MWKNWQRSGRAPKCSGNCLDSREGFGRSPSSPALSIALRDFDLDRYLIGLPATDAFATALGIDSTYRRIKLTATAARRSFTSQPSEYAAAIMGCSFIHRDVVIIQGRGAINHNSNANLTVAP